MTFQVVNTNEQTKLARETLKRLLRKEFGLEHAIFNPFDDSSQSDFEDYFIELNRLGLD